MTPANGTTDKLKLRAGEVHVIALAQPTGRTVKSNFGGDQVMFSLADGRKLYCDPYVQERINALRIAPGQPFEIGMVESVQGNQRSVSVEVRAARVGANAANTAPAPVVPTTGSVATPVHSTLPPPPTFTNVSAPVNGAGETAAQIMAQCYRDAIDVALSAIAYARENGLMLSPAFEDVRTMGTALFIQGSQVRR